MADYSINSGQVREEAAHLIDTAKIMRGRKLSSKDSLRKLVFKSKMSNRSKMQSITLEEKPEPRISEYTEKYEGLETIEDRDFLAKFISYKRVKHSRETIRGIKMVSRQQSRPKTSIDKAHKLSSSHRSWTNGSSPSKQMLSYEVRNSLTSSRKPSIKYNSQNLNLKMNEYLNLVLEKKEKDQLRINQKELSKFNINFDLNSKRHRDKSMNSNRNSMRESVQANASTSQNSSCKNQYKKLANNFYKRLKKQSKQQLAEPNLLSIDIQTGSKELVKQMKKQMEFKDQKACLKLDLKTDNSRVESMLSRQTFRNFGSSQHSQIWTKLSDPRSQTLTPQSSIQRKVPLEGDTL